MQRNEFDKSMMREDKCIEKYDPASFARKAEKLTSLLNSLPPSYPETIKKLMTKKRITAEELANRSGLTIRTVFRYRQGEINRPSLPNVIAICIGLQLDPVLSFDLISKAGIRLTASKEDTVYSLVLMTMSEMSITEVNRFLKEAGVAALSGCDAF